MSHIHHTAFENIQQQPNPAAPDTHPGRGSRLFSTLSIIASLLFIAYGMTVLFGLGISGWASVVGWASAGYGLLSLAALDCARRFRAAWCTTVSQVSAVCYLAILALALAVGQSAVLGATGILLTVLGLWCNWYAVTVVIRAA